MSDDDDFRMYGGGNLPGFNPLAGLGKTNTEKWLEFHAANPWVYPRIEKMAADLVERGRGFGIATIFEVLRYQFLRTTDANAEWKLNNTYRAFYTRLLLHRHPSWEGTLEKRKSEADAFDYSTLDEKES